MYANTSEGSGAITRWSSGIHNDFEARMDWSITGTYGDANHHPIGVVNGDTGKNILEVTAAAGSNVNLSAAGSSDPDSNELSYSWSFYSEPSTYSGAVNIQSNTVETAIVEVPSDAAGQTIHIVLEIHDNGTPNLYAYRRVIITVS
jgi:hypothetical protein